MELKDMKVFLTKTKIQNEIKKYAKKLNEKFYQRELVVLVVMNGALFFASDLIKNLTCKVILDSISVSSYADGKRTDSLVVHKDVIKDIKDKDVLIVEDIIDSGHTLEKVVNLIRAKKPKSLTTVCLVDNFYPSVASFSYDFLFKGPKKYLIGYGFDVNDNYRQLEDVYFYESENGK